ncbi:MAG: helix-turn-helix domain-containing protein [Proteobacteria bacterium]|nr:helix-turn-helix domain-containing protein [Pseudomonadota bacterium]MBU1715065.1 helix-turn-helix domain-containing protein [Pseudomonadota bacterium]
MTDQNLTGPPMIKIDGFKIKQLRETKGLTQLYIATVVEVTTDTISRWENKRYPSIKKENGLKLAEALEVELEAILEKQSPDTNSQSSPDPTKLLEQKSSGKNLSRRQLIITIGAILVVGTILHLYLFPPGSGKQIPVIASRILPSHTAPGQIFPVIIQIETKSAAPFSLIIKETLPPRCSAIKGDPTFTATTEQDNSLHWISRISGQKSYFSYLARCATEVKDGEILVFQGTVTPGKKSGSPTTILGPAKLLINYFHWADENRDGNIDDDEILTVYDRFNLIKGLELDRTQLDEIWAGQGYQWDEKSGRYLVLP